VHRRLAGACGDFTGLRKGAIVQVGAVGPERKDMPVPAVRTAIYVACAFVASLGAMGSTAANASVYGVIYNFGAIPNDGDAPTDGVIRAPTGTPYGNTHYGGYGNCTYGCGTVYALTSQGGETVLHRFSTV
jgi:uncharacterized repeat protein (TIGR03803 family)